MRELTFEIRSPRGTLIEGMKIYDRLHAYIALKGSMEVFCCTDPVMYTLLLISALITLDLTCLRKNTHTNLFCFHFFNIYIQG